MLGLRRSSFGGSRVGPVLGTSTNDNAITGNVGELVSSIIASPGSGISTATPADITSISLTAGDWDVSGVVALVPNAATSVTVQIGAINTTSATLPVVGDGGYAEEASAAEIPGGATTVLSLAPKRISVSVTTTVYLVVQATFSVNVMTAYGGIRARRVR